MQEGGNSHPRSHDFELVSWFKEGKGKKEAESPGAEGVEKGRPYEPENTDRNSALEQENRAQVEANRALVVLAESEIPKAIAESFRSGNLGIMDYYRLRNIQADTAMRDTIAGRSPGEPGRGKSD